MSKTRATIFEGSICRQQRVLNNYREVKPGAKNKRKKAPKYNLADKLSSLLTEVYDELIHKIKKANKGRCDMDTFNTTYLKMLYLEFPEDREEFVKLFTNEYKKLSWGSYIGDNCEARYTTSLDEMRDLYGDTYAEAVVFGKCDRCCSGDCSLCVEFD